MLGGIGAAVSREIHGSRNIFERHGLFRAKGKHPV